MNRISKYWSPDTCYTPSEPTMTRLEEMNRMKWRQLEKGNVWPSVWTYAVIGAGWLLAVAGIAATVLIVGCLFGMGFKFGWSI